MKKYLLLLLIIISCEITFSQSVTIESVRKAYYKLNTDSISCKKAFDKIQESRPTNNLIIGYKGAIYAAMANHVKSKQEKIKLFSEGKKLLEQSIKTDSINTELRFLRFTIQTNCPKTLGYSKQIEADKNFIISNFSSLKASDYKAKMAEYLINSSYLNASEKQNIKQ